MLPIAFFRRQTNISGVLALAALVLSGCGAPDRSAPPSAAAPTIAPAAVAAQPGDRLFIRDGFKSNAERLTIVDSASGARERDLPPGVSSPDWLMLYVAEYSDGKTTVRALDVKTGQPLREISLDGAYALPMITNDSVMGGLSPDGRWLALKATPNQPGGKKTRFVVLDTAFKNKPRQVDLGGDFDFDGLNNGGNWLYLTESLADDPAAKYQVRRYDLAGGALDPQVIFEKGEEGEPMSGARHTAVDSKNGDWLYSLYLNPSDGPFIHALPMGGQVAFCIDLPKDSKEDMVKQSRWSLVMSADKRTLYAVNGALGLVTEYNVGEGVPQMLRTKMLFETPAGTNGQAAVAPVISNVATLAPDGKTLFALGEQGLLAIAMEDLILRGIYLPDWTLDAVALSPDGARLYAASAAQGKIVRLDPSAGTIAAEVPAAGHPSGLLVRVETHR